MENSDTKILVIKRWSYSTFNPFLFIKGLSCPSCIQASLSLNFLKLTTFLDFLTTVFLDLVVTLALKKNPRSSIGLEIRPQSVFSDFRALLPSANYCILPSDLVGCDSPLQIVMAFWSTIIFSRGLSHLTQKVWIQTKRAPDRAVTPDRMGSIALW